MGLGAGAVASGEERLVKGDAEDTRQSAGDVGRLVVAAPAETPRSEGNRHRHPYVGKVSRPEVLRGEESPQPLSQLGMTLVLDRMDKVSHGVVVRKAEVAPVLGEGGVSLDPLLRIVERFGSRVAGQEVETGGADHQSVSG